MQEAVGPSAPAGVCASVGCTFQQPAKISIKRPLGHFRGLGLCSCLQSEVADEGTANHKIRLTEVETASQDAFIAVSLQDCIDEPGKLKLFMSRLTLA